jgi:YjbE family integral membrane protein
MIEFNTQFFVALLQIIWIDLILAGDNAVVIALACHGLPKQQRKWGIILGAAVAVLLRVIFTFILAYLLNVPFLKLIGGLLLLWIAVKLLVGGSEHHSADGEARQQTTLWQAVRMVAIADIVMSLDNMLAISGAAQNASPGNYHVLIALGLLISIPLIIGGSALITALVSRFPIFIWAGAALLGWIAGQMIVGDPWVQQNFADVIKRLTLGMNEVASISSVLGKLIGSNPVEYLAAAACAAFVCLLGWIAKRRALAARVAR